MARRQVVTVEGMDRLARLLRRLPDRVSAGAREAIKDETHDVAEDMRRGAPRDTGELAQSIQEEITDGGLSGAAVATARHATFVVHGTEDTPSNDFMTPAAERSRQRFRGRLVDALDRELKGLVK